MNAEKRERIINLSNDYSDKKSAFERIAMTNCPSSLEERKILNSEYYLAYAEMIEAKRLLDWAVEINE